MAASAQHCATWQRPTIQRPGILLFIALCLFLSTVSAQNQSTPCGNALNCENGGQCNQTPESEVGPAAFFCACPNGFSGAECQTQGASPNPGSPTCGSSLLCLNGGVCNQTPGAEANTGFFCACPNRFIGQDCGTPCGGALQPACAAISTAGNGGPGAPPLPAAPSLTSAPVTPSPTTAKPAANPRLIPTATQTCGPTLVCQHGGECNQTPGAETGQGYFCACLDGFTGLDCGVGNTAGQSAVQTSGSAAVSPVLTPGSTTQAARTGGSSGGVKAWVVVVAVVAGIAALALVVAGIFVLRRRRASPGALSYQRKDTAHAQMSAFENQGSAETV